MNSAVTMVFSEKKNKKNKTKSVEISTPVVRKCVLNNPDSVNQDNSLITSESSPSNPLSTSPSVQSSEPSPGYPVFCPPLYPYDFIPSLMFSQPSSIVYFPVANSQPISVNSPAVLSLTPLSTYYSVCNHPCSLVSDVFGYHTEGSCFHGFTHQDRKERICSSITCPRIFKKTFCTRCFQPMERLLARL